MALVDAAAYPAPLLANGLQRYARYGKLVAATPAVAAPPAAALPCVLQTSPGPQRVCALPPDAPLPEKKKAKVSARASSKARRNRGARIQTAASPFADL